MRKALGALEMAVLVVGIIAGIIAGISWIVIQADRRCFGQSECWIAWDWPMLKSGMRRPPWLERPVDLEI